MLPDAQPSLRAQVLSGAAWAAAGRIAAQLLQFAGGVVLARLLLPRDFGLLASVYVFAGFAAIFVDLGIGPAVVHARQLTEELLSAAFWLNALAGVVLALIMLVAAPALAALFHEPAITRIAPLLGLTFALSLSVVQIALLEREYRFRLLAIVELAGVVSGLAVTIAGALLGWSYYALAVGPVVQSLVLSCLCFAAVPWRPSLAANRRAFQQLWHYSAGLIGFNSVNYWVRNADNLLVGRYVGPAALGYYNRSYGLMLLPVTQVSQVVGRVVFPALSRVSDDAERLRNAYRTAVRVLVAGITPVVLALVAVAPAFVHVVYGSKWAPMVPLLQLLCLSGPPQTVAVTVGWLYQAIGRTREMFIAGTGFAAATVVAFGIGIHWGAKGVAAAWLIRCWVLLPIIVWAATRLVELSPWRVLQDSLWPTCAGAAMAGVASLEQVAMRGHVAYGPLLGIQLVTCAAIYPTVLGLLSPDRLQELWGVLRRRGLATT